MNCIFTNRAKDGADNICGKNIAVLRKNMGISQRMLADLLQIDGLDIDKNAIQRMESGKCFVTDIELLHLSKVLNKEIDELVNAK